MEESSPYGMRAKQLVEAFLNNEPTRGLVLLRHSARHYDKENPIREPFMGLTEEGKTLSYQWGKSLPPEKHLNFFSSFIGRCIETAYLIDKGYVAGGGVTRHNIIEPTLSPFYVRDALRLFDQYLQGSDFMTSWFDGLIPAEVIDRPERIAAAMMDFWKERLADETASGQVDVCVTHDWNIYVLRWYFLGLPIAAQKEVRFLDGLVVFRKKNRYYIADSTHDPRELRMT